jgi:hypothetical protein
MIVSQFIRQSMFGLCRTKPSIAILNPAVTSGIYPTIQELIRIILVLYLKETIIVFSPEVFLPVGSVRVSLKEEMSF